MSNGWTQWRGASLHLTNYLVSGPEKYLNTVERDGMMGIEEQSLQKAQGGHCSRHKSEKRSVILVSFRLTFLDWDGGEALLLGLPFGLPQGQSSPSRHSLESNTINSHCSEVAILSSQRSGTKGAITKIFLLALAQKLRITYCLTGTRTRVSIAS